MTVAQESARAHTGEGVSFNNQPKAEMNHVSESPRVFTFRQGNSAGRASMKALLGGKGANLCEMARIGLNVPPGFTIATSVCKEFYESGGKLPDQVWTEVLSALEATEEAYGAKFGNTENPLLVSVRSGAAISMPGMMDTVLNLGLNDEIIKSIAARNGERFAYDSYRRLLDMYADVVLGADRRAFEEAITDLKAKRGVTLDVELTAEDLMELVRRYKDVYRQLSLVLPENPRDQLREAICAVFRSWNTPRAVKFREINRINGLIGTAVTVQSMVYGNLNGESGTGVCFSRNPSTGEHRLFGEFLSNAQGEDVVAGIRTPLPISEMETKFPEAYADLLHTTDLLESHMKDMQDMEFTVQNNKLFMLQTRNGKRTGPAALKVAVDLVAEGLVSKEGAINMVEPRHLEQLLHPLFANEKAYRAAKAVLGGGLAASPGAAVGRVVFTAEDAEAWEERGEKVVLVRVETSPEDVGGMHAAQGILTQRGGMTSHAAVVARGWGKPCVCGCETLSVDYGSKASNMVSLGFQTATIGGKTLREGDWISLNGTSGEVILGKQPLVAPSISGDLATFMGWVDSVRRLGVLANADTPADAAIARKNGAGGIGLTRTEHMFFSSPARIAAIRRMIGAMELGAGSGSEEALAQLQVFQREDFEGIFEAMDGLPVTIRLLDPPLHEFLPKEGTAALHELVNKLASNSSVTPEAIERKIKALEEVNPMMGFRGCRLGVVHPAIPAMQVAAILEAAVNVSKRGIRAHPHIMVPLVGIPAELDHQIAIVHKTAKEVFARTGTQVEYLVGTMIEVPRGALQAGELAAPGRAQFFSFGTNDLTQMTFGFSRDDAQARFLPAYVKQGLLPCDPFQTIDTVGVGELIRTAVQRGRDVNPGMELGVCGEHGGDPDSVHFFHDVGVDYVSCSPLRVPLARLAAAQAALRNPIKKA